MIAALFFTFSGCSPVSVGGDVAEVTVWSGITSAKQSLAEIVDYYNRTIGKKDGVRIVLDVKDGSSINQMVVSALESGEGPDLFDTVSIDGLVENDYIFALEDLPGTQGIIDRCKYYLVEGRSTYNGKTYRVSRAVQPQGLIYNKEMFKKAGIVDENGDPTPPKTFDEMREYAKRLTDTSKQQYGIILPFKWDGWFKSDVLDPMQSSVGHTGYNPVTGKYDFSGLVPIMNTYLGMRDDGSVYPGSSELTNDQARALFASGGIGMKMGYAFDIAVYNEQFPADFEIGVAPYPLTDENVRYRQRMDYGGGFYINKNATKHASIEKIMSVWNFFSGDEYTRLAYEKEMSLPYSRDAVKDVKLKNPSDGWVEFSEMVNISACEPLSPKYDKSGFESAQDRFIKYVWTCKQTPQQMADKYTADITAATDRYYSTHKKESGMDFMNQNWDIMLH